jgi:RNA polymerase sigma-70 factor, ECF subfamily
MAAPRLIATGAVGCRAEAQVGKEKICSRDAGDLAACFAAHAGGLFGYACVLARGDRALADDLVQAAFEAAARDWGILRCLAEEQRRAWLRTTVANVAVSGFRREAAWRDRLPRIEARYRKNQADTETVAFSLIVLDRCWQIIKDMPEQQHAVAVLRWQQGMKQAEIAAVLGMAEKTVSVHLHRARRRLIAQLGPDYPFASDDGEGRAL